MDCWLRLPSRGTFRIPDETGARPAAPRPSMLPLTTSDEFFGEPGLSAPKCEDRFRGAEASLRRAPQCPRTHPAAGRRRARTVGARIGSWFKSFDVVGDRHWESSVTGIRRTPAIPFAMMPITCDRAFGGTDDTNILIRRVTPRSWRIPSVAVSTKRPHANTLTARRCRTPRESGNEVTALAATTVQCRLEDRETSGNPRAAYAGTYDQHWLDEVFPFCLRTLTNARLPGGTARPAAAEVRSAISA